MSAPEPRRIYTDEYRLCENCMAEGGPGKRLMRCKGCDFSWYCGPECQKAKWKEHKVMCKEQQEMRRTAPKALVDHQIAFTHWCRRNTQQLGIIGNHALLQHKDQPSQTLIETHLLYVGLKPAPGSTSEFDIDVLKVCPLNELRNNYGPGSQGDANYKATLQKSRQSCADAEKTFGSGAFIGIMWIVAHSMDFRIAIPLLVAKEVADHHRLIVQSRNWVEMLKDSVARKENAVYRMGGGHHLVTARPPQKT